MATRSPWPDAHVVEGQGHPPGPGVQLAEGDVAEGAGGAGFVHRRPSDRGYTVTARSRKSEIVNGTFMASLPMALASVRD